MKFGERLKELRLERALSQKALADLSGMTERTIQNYEIAGMLPKRRETYERLAAALGVDVSVLLGEDEAFALAANTRYGSRGERQARAILDQVNALYAGGDLSEEDKDAFNRALQEAYWEAKEINRKFTPTKYRKAPREPRKPGSGE